MDLGKVGKFIAELRKEKKLTQAQLGEKVGVTDKTVSKWEQGICAPNISILNELSEILGITTTELLNGKRFEDISKKELADTTTKGMKYYINLSKKSLIKKMFAAILVTIILAISIIAFLFFKNNYDNCYVYELSSADPNYTVEGVMIVAPDKEIFIINLIENTGNKELAKKKLYSYEYSFDLEGIPLLSRGNIELYSYKKGDSKITYNEMLREINTNSIENFSDSYIRRNLNNKLISMKLQFISENIKKEEQEIKIKLTRLYVNDKIMNES